MALHKHLNELAKMKFGPDTTVLRDYGFHYDTEFRSGYWLKQAGSPAKRYLGKTDDTSEQAILSLPIQAWETETKRYKKGSAE